MFLKDWNRLLHNRYLRERQTSENCISLYLFIYLVERDGRMKGVGLGIKRTLLGCGITQWLQIQIYSSGSGFRTLMPSRTSA